jgi:rubrerythrin
MEMTWEEILNRAIAKEEEAYSNYHAMAKRASNPGAQTMFNGLAEEEGRHKAILTNWKSGKLPGCPLSSLADLSGIGEGRDIKFDRDLTPEEAVRLAIQEEGRAFAFYSTLAKGLEDAEAKCLAERLAAEERGHRSKLERLLEEEMFQEM